MAKKKKSGNTMLRMEPKLHARVNQTAEALGMSMNSLLNLLINLSLPFYEIMARAAGELNTEGLFSRWQSLNPQGSMTRFLLDVGSLGNRRTGGVFPKQFDDGKWYLLNEASDDFVEVPEPEWAKQRWVEEVTDKLCERMKDDEGTTKK